MQEIPEPLKDLAEELGAPVGGRRWEMVTAVLGWGAAASLTAFLAATMLGFADLAKAAFAAFGFLFGVAFKRDVQRILTSVRPTSPRRAPPAV